MGFISLQFNKAKGSSDTRMSNHIDRKSIPDNADPRRTCLNRELVELPEGVADRDGAITHRIQTAGIKRKITADQVRAIRVVLSGTHGDMMQIVGNRQLDNWCDDNLRWLNMQFGKNNVVSVVLHMDEETPHLHATVIPIVTGERRKAKSEQDRSKRKYRKKAGDTVRLCADDVLTRDKLIAYHDSYAQAMAKYGLQRGVRGSEARHTTTLQYYRELKKKNTEMVSGLNRLQELKTDAEKELQQVKNEIRADRLKGATTTAVTNIAESVGSLFGSNKFKLLEKENRQLYQEIAYRDEDIATLQQQIQTTENEHSRQILEMQRQHQKEKTEMIKKHEEEVSLKNKVLAKAVVWFPLFRPMLRIEKLCHSIGFNAEQSAHLMTGKPLTYSGELYSEEHNLKIKVNDTVFTVVTDKGKLVLAVGSQHIGDWFKEQIEKSNRMNTRQQIKKNRGFRL